MEEAEEAEEEKGEEGEGRQRAQRRSRRRRREEAGGESCCKRHSWCDWWVCLSESEMGAKRER